VLVGETGWIGFQEYFVIRRAQDQVDEVRFTGSESASPAPEVVESIRRADHVVIAPSNPPLSIWPILSIEGIREAVVSHPKVTAVSPLIGGRALKGPADRVLASLGLPAGNLGVAKSYEGVINRLIVDSGDAGDANLIEDVEVLAFDTKIKEPKDAERLAREILAI
jgi:LPPG:FO 2-phospho-L-lactate transferase